MVAWCDLVTTLEGKDGERGVLVRRMPGDKLGVRRADGTMFEAHPVAPSVVDRSYFRPGDIVASESDPGGQIGVVTGASGALDLVRFDADGRRQQGPAAVVSRSSRPSEELRRVTSIVRGDYVVSGPWLGQVVEVSLAVDVAFDDGGLCSLDGAERKLVGEGAQAQAYEQDDVPLKNGRQTNSVLYPGQRVVASSPSVFRRESRWIRGYWKPSRVRGTVCRVDVAGVLVHWVASMELGTNKALIQASAPPAWQPSLQKLALFPYPATESSIWYIGDRCLFRAPPDPYHECQDHQHVAAHPSGVDDDDDDDDEESPHSRAHGRLTTRSHVKRRQTTAKRKQRQAKLERPMSVAGTRTTVDVLWQDGTRQRGVPSPSLQLFNTGRNDYDFFPGQHVISSAHACEQAAAAARSGVVQSLNCRDKTVCVSWFPVPTVEGETSIVSAYDVARDPRANFFYGEISSTMLSFTCGGNVVVHLRRNPPQVVIAKDDDGHHDLDLDLSWVGHIAHLCCEDGLVQVKWGDVNTSKVLPRDIAVVKPQKMKEILEELGDWLYDNGDMDGEKKEQEVAEAAVAAVAQEHVAAAGITGGGGGGDTNNGSNAEGAPDSSDDESVSEDNPAVTTEVKAGDGSSSITTEVKASDGFLRFDVVQSPPADHHFIDNMKQQDIPVGRKWTKRIQKEWKILENDLPDTIYVRAFEDRMDLLRVVMMGASGTPYHDGLFFFDLHLPPSYPSEPPLVNYRSFGLRVNPNLYPSGTVCLSLLNTFGGEGAEQWSPEASTILQVVVSIQGLVLTAQPYYNEAAHGAHAGTAKGLRNELPYSENTYLLNLQTMLQLLRRPPASFEVFVRDHFRRRAQHVLRAWHAYQDGCLVGTLDEEGRPTLTEGSDDKRRPCSAGFRLALLNVLPRLVEAFANVDAQGCKA